jgi:hypothetical protein
LGLPFDCLHLNDRQVVATRFDDPESEPQGGVGAWGHGTTAQVWVDAGGGYLRTSPSTCTSERHLRAEESLFLGGFFWTGFSDSGDVS